ncbi:primosomal protein N' [bacterium]|nr:primosomal protein N' [bacterium]
MNKTILYNIAVHDPLPAIYTYSCPESLGEKELIGYRVLVPLAQKKVIGVVVERVRRAPQFKLRSVLDVLDEEASLPQDLLEFCKWMSHEYICSLADTIAAAIPAGLLQPPHLTITFEGAELEGLWPSEVLFNRDLLKLARAAAGRERASMRELGKLAGTSSLIGRLRKLEELGLIKIHEHLKFDQSTTLTDEWVNALPGASLDAVPQHHKARYRLLETILSYDHPVAWSLLQHQINASKKTLNTLIELGLVEVERKAKEYHAKGYDPRGRDRHSELTVEQKNAVDEVSSTISNKSLETFLLFGTPGAGKTRVYLEILNNCIKSGRTALLLVPEIGLTPQVVARIQGAIDAKVAVLHSTLTTAQRLAAWREVREGRIGVVVGPRSAVFAPLENIGLIILDEEHEDSFKQQERAPLYHAREAAIQRALQHNATLLLVSATPSLESLYMVENGSAEILKLTERFGAGWPEINVVDRRREKNLDSFIGKDIADEVNEVASRKEGIILLINRRGYAPVLVCKDCGELTQCPNCTISLTFHQKREKVLRCHVCGYIGKVPDQCKHCESTNLILHGAGTQRIEDEVHRRFAHLKQVRMDYDTTRKEGTHAAILHEFGSGESQILLGTQMVAKGHDFGHVTLVGVVNADTGLFLPDFRAAEKTFRLLVQAAGRAGRGDKPGKVIVQTLEPTHNVFQSLHQPNVEGFLQNELGVRKMFQYPPYARLVLVTFASIEDARAQKGAEDFVKIIRDMNRAVSLNGPVPALVPRLKRKFRWRVLLKTVYAEDAGGRRLLQVVREAVNALNIHREVQVKVDVDPVEVV